MLKACSILVAPILIVISCVGSSLGQTAPTADRVLVAEGDFVAQTKEGVHPLSHWKLWRLGDGGYEVVDQKLQNTSSVETFEFDAQLMPTGFTKSVGPPRQIQNSPQSHGVTISCRYKSKELACTAESSEGKKSSVSIAADPPYVFMGEFYDLDFAWFMTGVVNLASRGNAKNGLVNVYFLTDGAKPDEIGLEADQPLKITPVGQEVGQFDGKQQVLKEFKWEGQGEFYMVRTNAKPMVVGINNGANSEIGMAISNYKEYVPWGPTP
jgi:hypothetical protein